MYDLDEKAKAEAIADIDVQINKALIRALILSHPNPKAFREAWNAQKAQQTTRIRSNGGSEILDSRETNAKVEIFQSRLEPWYLVIDHLES